LEEKESTEVLVCFWRTGHQRKSTVRLKVSWQE